MVFKRGLYLICGLCSLALGLLGIPLPILPTVPFILLAAFCFARSSERLHQWLMNHPWFSEALADWEKKRAMRKGLKRKAYIVSGLSFAASITIVPLIWVKVMLVCCAIGLGLYLRQIPELED
ncbi:YbaN family protein [Shewanella sp. D64]|uniref:YbaN family protein n=1 Tax=unclassified Shewanella TaxID=196818 RepID=UPI0022BA47FB|nr:MULTISPECIES: YbaN family protein [unclassified Shewanella]MEC4725666.1 YbaN family protein [Shewanella sp. D64]MEC4737727.1 YbaN family protein [Shewanella sp. E94]WBJ98208.1 YbaN family protein [Shewanella sp. MTB7]